MVSNIFYFHPYCGNDPIWLYNIFQMGWNHQLAKNWNNTMAPPQVTCNPKGGGRTLKPWLCASWFTFCPNSCLYSEGIDISQSLGCKCLKCDFFAARSCRVWAIVSEFLIFVALPCLGNIFELQVVRYFCCSVVWLHEHVSVPGNSRCI